MLPSIVVLSTQIKNMKMGSLKLIMKSNAKKLMAQSGFECRFIPVNMLNSDFIFLIT